MKSNTFSTLANCLNSNNCPGEDSVYSTKKIGIYGGSFNPIHSGHFKTAKYLLDKNYLDEIQFLINPCSPFKTTYKMPDAYHRANAIMCAILKLTDSYNDKITLNNTEMLNSIHSDVCYTVDTLKSILYADVVNKESHEFYLIIGADVFNDIKRFKNYQWFLEEKLVKLIILPRGGYTIDSKLKEEFKDVIYDVDFSKFTPIEMSSTYVRDVIKNGDDKEMDKILVPGAIDYIKSNKLYDYPKENSVEKDKASKSDTVTYEIPDRKACKTLVRNFPKGWHVDNYRNSDIDDCFCVVSHYCYQHNEYNIYDFITNKLLFPFNVKSKLHIYNVNQEKYKAIGSGESFQCDGDRYNTKSFANKHQIHYTIIEDSTQEDKVVAFNHKKVKVLFTVGDKLSICGYIRTIKSFAATSVDSILRIDFKDNTSTYYHFDTNKFTEHIVD